MADNIFSVHEVATAQVSEFMALYGMCLDNRDMRGWADFFAREAKYSVASSENVNGAWSLLLINDDTKSKIEDRVRYVHEFWEGSYNEYLPRHIMSLPVLISASGNTLTFEQSFALYMTESDVSSDQAGDSSILCVGKYDGTLSCEEGRLKFIDLHAVLDTFSLTRSLVYPV